MKSRYLLNLFILVFTLSCTKQKEEVIVQNLSSKKLEVKEILNPDKIRISGNYLFILESPSIDANIPPIHVFDIRANSYLKSFGTIGFGPGEISDASSIEFADSDSTFFIYSAIDKKISEFSFSQTDLARNQIKQKGDFFKAYSVVRFEDSTFLGMTVDSPSRLVKFSFTGDSITGYGHLENFSERTDLNYFNLSQMNMGWLASNSSKTHFVIANLFSNKIEVFDRNLLTVERFYLSPKEFMNFDLIEEPSGYSVHWDLNSPYHFRDVVVTDNEIIALYGGISESKIQSDSDIAKTIYIFSFEGEIIAKYSLDRSIKSLAVNNELSKIYGISTDSEPGIVEFDVPSLD